MSAIARAIDAAVRRHGSLNKAARVLQVNAGNLSRIRAGLRHTSDETLLRALGLERRVTYVKRKRPKEQPQPMEG
jgi:hypothetical protein